MSFYVFRRKLLRYVRLMAWAVRLLSVCRLSFVTLLRPTQMAEHFGSIDAPLSTRNWSV